jgi:hypothetical protein
MRHQQLILKYETGHASRWPAKWGRHVITRHVITLIIFVTAFICPHNCPLKMKGVLTNVTVLV